MTTAISEVEHTLDVVATLPRDAIRAYILGLQETIKGHEAEVPDSTAPVKHHFAPGAYAREITLPAGVVIVGKLHRHEHISVISKGRVAVLTDAGKQVLQAPCTFISPAGVKRVVMALEETVWTTVHITNETDLAAIERETIADDYTDIEIQGELIQ